MARILVDVSDDTLSKLNNLKKQHRLSRSALIRKAVDSWLQDQPRTKIEDVFGILKNNPVDGLNIQHKLRNEW